MKYAIIGAGGTGGSLGFFLTKAGKDVTLIARGKHLEAIRKNGLGMERLWDHKREMIPVKACTVEEYSDTPVSNTVINRQNTNLLVLID